MTHVLAVGLATLDVIHIVARPPGPNTKVVAERTRLESGGPALNAAVTAAYLGADVRLVTAVGEGPVSGLIAADLAAHGVDLVDLALPGFQPPVSSVLVSAATGERAVASSNALEVSAYRPIPAGVLDNVRALLVDGHHLRPAIEIAHLARERGLPVLLDGGSWKPGLDALLARVDIAVTSADFAPPDGDDILDLGPHWAARTDGARAVRWWDRGGRSGLVNVPATRVVDTLGAGDVLHGAMLEALGSQDVPDPLAALEVGVAAATCSVSRPGARGWHHHGGPR